MNGYTVFYIEMFNFIFSKKENFISANNLEIIVLTIQAKPSVYLFIGFLIFFFGLFGILIVRINLLYIMIFLEIMLLGLGLLYLTVALYRGDINGFIMTLLIQTVAAGEAAVGLSLIVSLHRLSIVPQFNYF